MSLNHRNFLELQGELVYLRKFDKEYIDVYWECFKNSCVESTIFTGTQQVFSKSDLEGFVESIASDHSRVDFLIFTIEKDELVGEVVLNDMSRLNRSANIRVGLFQTQHFGHGYGTEAMVLALNYGFGMLHLHRIDLGVFPFNKRGIHVYEKLGFQREGVQRDAVYFDHRYHDQIIMSILEDEFREKYRSLKAESLEDFI